MATSIKSTKDLRGFLVEQMEAVADGNLEPDKCKGIANLAQQIYNTVNIEIKMAKAKESMEDGAIVPVSFDA